MCECVCSRCDLRFSGSGRCLDEALLTRGSFGLRVELWHVGFAECGVVCYSLFCGGVGGRQPRFFPRSNPSQHADYTTCRFRVQEVVRGYLMAAS